MDKTFSSKMKRLTKWMCKPLHKIATVVLVLFLIASSFGPGQLSTEAAEGDRTLKILGIGNSFTVDGMEYITRLALEAGADDVIIGTAQIGGSSLQQHANWARTGHAGYNYRTNVDGRWVNHPDSTLKAAIEAEDWDFITFQQVSGLSGVASTYNQDIETLIDFINEHKTNPDAKIGWQMTWAYQSDSNHGDFGRYNRNQMTMYEAIVSTTQEKIATNDRIDFIIPSGTAIQNLRTSYIGDTLTRDGYHLTEDLGRFTASMTWLHEITGWSIDDLEYLYDSVAYPPELLQAVKEAVYNAVKTPFAVTNSSYTEEPGWEAPDYHAMYADREVFDWEPDGLGFWNSHNGIYALNAEPARGSSGLAVAFVPSARRFTKEDIPVGSVIIIDEGYQYRPDGWAPRGGGAPGRPGNITLGHYVVDEAFWADYEYRAFNVSVVGTPNISNRRDEVINAFTIYLPEGYEAPEEPVDPEQPGDEEVEYELFDWQPDPYGYWYALGSGQDLNNPHIIRDAGNSPDFIPSATRFTKEDLPVGTLVEITEPNILFESDYWLYDGAGAGRDVSIWGPIVYEITEEFWEGVEYRSINSAMLGRNLEADDLADDVIAALNIWVPVEDTDEETPIDNERLQELIDLIAELEERIRELEGSSEVTDLESRIDSLEQDLAALQARAEELEDENDNLAQLIADLQAEIAELRDLLEENPEEPVDDSEDATKDEDQDEGEDNDRVENPKTLDRTNNGLYLALAGGSLLALLVFIMIKRRSNKD